MQGAAERFARELRRHREANAATVAVRCGTGAGVRHELTVSAIDLLEPLDHDVEAERVLSAVGGEPPTCLRLMDLVPRATAPQLWTSIRGSHVSDNDGARELLERLPPQVRCRLLAARLDEEFSSASDCVRETIAKLGLSLLSPGYQPSAADVARFQLTRTLPRWDTGPRSWSDKELVLLQRHLRFAPGERSPHLGDLPTDPEARRVVSEYAASALDDHHLYTRSELAETLRPVFHNVSRLIRVMLDQGALEESSGCYRTRRSSAQPRRSMGRRS